MKGKLQIITIFLLIVCTMSGCAGVPEDTTHGAAYTDLPKQIDWAMTSFVVDSNGNISDGPIFTAEGKIEYVEKYSRARLDIMFEFHGDFRYSFTRTEGDGDLCTDFLVTEPGDYATQPFVYDKVTNSPAIALWAINTEKEYFIAWFEEDGGQYLLASTDPNVKPEDILAHFAGFVEYVSQKEK